MREFFPLSFGSQLQCKRLNGRSFLLYFLIGKPCGLTFLTCKTFTTLPKVLFAFFGVNGSALLAYV
jgi:hypothetical protein